MIRYLLIASAATLAPLVAMAQVGTSPPPITVNLLPPSSAAQGPSVVGITLNGGSTAAYTSGIASGASIGSVAIKMSNGGTYNGTATLSGLNAADFTLTNTSLNANSSTPTCTSSTNYPVNISAPPGQGESGSTYSQQVTVTCNPSSSLAAPTPASTAGFTTLALNMDFTGATQSKLNGTNFNADALSTWLDCAGAPGSPAMWQQAGPSITTDCEFSIVNDSGTNVLNVHWGDSNYPNGKYLTQMQTCDGSASTCSAATFPVGKYIEYTMKISSSTAGLLSGGGILGDFWSWPVNNSGFEWDFLEIYPDISSGGSECASGTGGTWAGCSNTPPLASTPSYFTSYHKYGLLITSDGSGNLGACEYIDGVAVDGGGSAACSSSTGYSAATSRNYLLVTGGPQGNTHGDPGADMDMYVQSVRVWECSGWASGQCNGTVITSAP